jgi:hypothetical protein
MEINKKVFLTAISQVKAYKDVIVLKDSPVEGCLDILYGVKCAYGMPNCINKMTIRLGGLGIDLFDDTPVEKLGNPTPVFLSRVKGAIKDANVCILKDGCINGIPVEVEKLNVNYSMFTWITNVFESYSESLKNIKEFDSISLRKIDYAYMVSELSKFVEGSDPTKNYISGICFNFVKGGKDFIHMVATDGRKMCFLKQAATHSEYPEGTEMGEFIVPPAYLHLPNSEYSSAKIQLSGQYGRVIISTEDYHFEGMFECLDAKFPNYLRVMPELTKNTQWFTLCAASFKMTIESVKGLMGRSGTVYLNAENPESLYITVAEEEQHFEVEGTASRPMRLSFLWENFSACLFDGLALTKFYLEGSNKAVITHEARAVKGLTLDVTKLFMPTQDSENHKEDDEFRIPKPVEKSDTDSESSSEPDARSEPENSHSGDDPLDEPF